MSVLFLHEKLSGKKIVALIAAFAGCICVTGIGQGMHVGTMGIVTGLLSGEVDAAMCNTPEGMSNVDADQLKILCSFASSTFKDYPDVPLAINSSMDALKNLVIEQWRGVAVPVDTPDDVVAELEAVIEKVVTDEDFIAKCDSMSIVARFRNTKDYNEFVQAENARFENLCQTKKLGDRYGSK